MAAKDSNDMVCIGIVTGAHGVRGSVRIKPFTEDPGAITAYGDVVDDDGTPVRLTLSGEVRGQLLARVHGIGDRTAAEAYKGRRLYVRRSALPMPADDEFYHVDLIGLRAEPADDSGVASGTESDTAPLGIVRAVHDHGAGAILELENPAGGTVLVPFTRDAVPVVDVAGGRVVVASLPGLFDAGENAQ